MTGAKSTQDLIQKVLSMEFAEEMRDMFLAIKETSTKGAATISSPLNPDIQDDLLFLGSAGKLGTAMYSNFQVFHAQTQQTSGGKVTIKNLKDTQVGNFKVSGELGNEVIIKPDHISSIGANNVWKVVSRNISEAGSEKQNTAMDNANVQVMGNVGVTSDTLVVDALMTLLGTDKDVIKISVKEAMENPISVYAGSTGLKLESVEDIIPTEDYYRVVSYPNLLVSHPAVKNFLASRSESIFEFSEGETLMQVLDTYITKILGKNAKRPS